MSYKFDGKRFKYRGKTLANISGDRIREGTGSKTLANIKGDRVRERTGGSTLINVKGRDIREGTGSRRIAKMDDIDKMIDGPGGITKAALWYLFIK